MKTTYTTPPPTPSKNLVLERDVERHLVKRVAQMGGRCFKWVSPEHAGVPDRICTSRPTHGCTGQARAAAWSYITWWPLARSMSESCKCCQLRAPMPNYGNDDKLLNMI